MWKNSIWYDSNSQRDRRLGDEVVISYHDKVEHAYELLKNQFYNVWIVDNNEDINLSDRPYDKIIKVK